MKTYHLLYHPTQIDLRLVLQDGKVLAHLPNYIPVLPEEPVNTDGAMQLLTFRVPASLVHVVNDGGVNKHYLWAGDRGTRSNPNDLVRVEIAHVGAQAAVTSPAQAAQEVFLAMPDEVKLAAMVAATPVSGLREYFNVSDEQMVAAKELADGTLRKYAQELADREPKLRAEKG
jgi:hypothetical protein